MDDSQLIPILIFECANAHGGDFLLLKKTINTFGAIEYPRKHIKFQPLHPERIALKDFAWYSVYEELFFQPEQWGELISSAGKQFDGIWLDIFDTYGVEILSYNLDQIHGIKLQTSILENKEVINALTAIDISDKFLMLNISGYELSDIERFIDDLSAIKPKELILQIGYQSYPTKIEDTGLQKIAVIKSAFSNFKLCLADHVSAEDEMVSIIPLLGLSAGCDLVEKHICLDRSSAKYDSFSALEFSEMHRLTQRLIAWTQATYGRFISETEKLYLSKTIQIPVAVKNLNEGSMISATDVIFRRTAQEGESLYQLLSRQSQSYILAESISPGSTIKLNQLKPAKVGVIVACRMKSSRLKSKAILPIGGLPSVERCLHNALNIKEASVVVLATSVLEEDSILKNYTLGGEVKFWQGNPDDVIQRYLGACDEFGIDVIVRVTADCPVISTEIAEYLLAHHFKSGADYTAAKTTAVGTGCEIYNAEVLRRVIRYLGKAEYSEYMTWYMQNNKDLFKVELVDLPEDLIRNYRLTLDYPEDLALFNQLFERLNEKNLSPNLKNIFSILDGDKQLANLNAHIGLRYKTDQSLIDLLNSKTRINLTNTQ